MEYIWKDNPVQLASNLSLPGGFKLGAFGSEYCDVVTATGRRKAMVFQLRTSNGIYLNSRNTYFIVITLYMARIAGCLKDLI